MRRVFFIPSCSRIYSFPVIFPETRWQIGEMVNVEDTILHIEHDSEESVR